MDRKVYEKCKKVVKKWEVAFKKENGRIPSKYDFHEAEKTVREAYRTYVTMKTSQMGADLADIFDDSSQISISQPAPTSFSLPDIPFIDEDSCGPTDENKASFNRINEKAWTQPAKKSPKKEETAVRKTVSLQRIKSNRSFQMRNPLKALNKTLSSSSITSNASSFNSQNDDALPDLETILIERSKRHLQSQEEVKKTPESEPLVNTVDPLWLSRRDPSEPVNSDSLPPVRLGLSNVVLASSSQISEVTYESDESAVANSEDESTITQSSRSRRSIRHIIKKRRVEESPEIEPPKETLEEQKPRRSLREKVQEKVEPECQVSEDEDLFGDVSDDNDPTYKKSPEKKTRQKEPRKKSKVADKVTKIAKRVVGRGTRKAKTEPVKPVSDSEELNKSAEFNDYVLEFGIERLENVPRANLKELQESQSLIERYILTDPSLADTQKSAPTAVINPDRLKLEKKIAAGSLNDNFRTINIQKKVFVRGKKHFNFSKYKKTQWKKKKAAALSGPEMDMGGCDGGLLTCFNCGNVGHMARQCKVKGDNLLPLEAAGEEASPFPTLEEAQEMVENQKLLVHSRRPQTVPNTEEKSLEVDMAELLDSVPIVQHVIPEEFLRKSGMLERIASKDTIEPLYAPNSKTPAEVTKALHLFGHSEFRPGQEEAVMRILSGQSTLVTLSTGSGKSLCYQLPAYLFRRHRKCITLVISPLVSLMEDQVTGVPKFLNAQCLHTNQTDKVREKIMLMVKEEKVDVLLVSPEAVVAGEKSTGFGALLRRLPPIAFACIDEAHCVSQWSHNFRPSYLSICRVLKEKLKVRTILGLTATATKSTRLSIIEHIGVPDGERGIISDIVLPENLLLTVSKDRERDTALLELIKSDRFSSCHSIIVYCTRREECERVASLIRTAFQDASVPAGSSKRKRANWVAEPYHAGLPASRRRSIQNAFMSGGLRICVATVAFGMGINKADIRAIVHYNMPKSFESYVQEVGRAGRDGKPANCHVFLDSQGRDRNELRRHIYANSIDRHVIRRLLQKVFVPCACAEGSQSENLAKSLSDSQKRAQRLCPGHEVCFSIESTVQLLDVPEENIATLLCYLELHDQRYVQVLSKAYTRCKVSSYAGAKGLREAAQKCPPLAMAIALELKKQKMEEKSNVVEFNVVEVASAIGWDSGVVKYQLKQLEWTSESGSNRRSKITVTFEDLGFRVRAPGDMTDEELDEALELLYRRVSQQEKAELSQLQAVFDALSDVSFNSYLRAVDSNFPTETSNKLKAVIRHYFSSDFEAHSSTEAEVDVSSDDVLLQDIRTMIHMYPENNFNGRALARIFHGVPSPNYPAVIWGRCKFWRAHMASDFNRIVFLANAELVRRRL